MKKKVTVEIFGEQYSLKTDFEEEYITELAKIVNDSMIQIAHQTRSLAGNKISVLAAIKIANEYLQIKKNYEELIDLMKKA